MIPSPKEILDASHRADGKLVEELVDYATARLLEGFRGGNLWVCVEAERRIIDRAIELFRARGWSVQIRQDDRNYTHMVFSQAT